MMITRCLVIVSDACQINDFDHRDRMEQGGIYVSDACQINDFDHFGAYVVEVRERFRCLSDQ